MTGKIKIGISTCLLGENVRYDGGHKRDNYLVNILGRYVEYVPVCPEVECGMPIPREAMRLIGNPGSPRLVQRSSGTDVTNQMEEWIPGKLKQLEKEQLCGFIFQKNSPSSGLYRIKVYNEKGMGEKKGVGIFARAFTKQFPYLPVEDDGRLHDPMLRENFIQRIFVEYRWKNLLAAGPSRSDLVSFHTQHKLLLMAHSPSLMRELGAIVAHISEGSLDSVYDAYYDKLISCLKLPSTIKKNVNVLQHIAGYFKKQLSTDEKKEIGEIINSYHQHTVPLIVPVTIMNHYIRKYKEEYLGGQYYLHPHPDELALRNHV